MTEITPSVLFDLIDKEKLDELNRIIYDGTKKFIDLCEMSNLSISTSGTYHLHIRGVVALRDYFSFMGYHNRIFVDILHPIADELLGVARDDKLMKIVKDAEDKHLKALIPLNWSNARQTNSGLFEGAAQFDINPPCLRIGTSCKYNEFINVVENLTTIVNGLMQHQITRSREG
jgi:hypothetical protein